MHRVRVPLLALVVALAGGAAAVAPSASAHSGSGAVFDGAAGPYRVLAYDGATGPQGALEFAALVQDGQSRPVDGAQVLVNARREGLGAQATVGPLTADAIANVYRYRLPDAGPWEVTMQVDDEQGEGTATFTVHGVEPAAAVEQVASADTGTRRRALTALALSVAALAWAAHVGRRWRTRRGVTRAA